MITDSEVKGITLGQSEINLSDLGDKKTFLQGLVDQGLITVETSNVLYYAIAPKGHDDHAPLAAAAIQHNPTVNPATTQNRALKQLLGVFQAIFHADDIKEIAKAKAAADEEKRLNSHRGSKPRLSVEERATRMATAHLSAQFRSVHKLPDRGKFSLEMAEKYKVYIEDKLPKAIEKFTKEITKKQAQLEPAPALA